MAVGIIPARYGSTRFPGKPLAYLAGRRVIAHVIAAASATHTVEQVYVATDDSRIADAVTEAGATPVMTSSDHRTGTDRIVEALDHISLPPDEIVVNIQGDEPLVEPDVIDRCVSALKVTSAAAWSTPVYPLQAEESRHSPQRVKVVRDTRGFALYFSRAEIPYCRDNDACTWWGHIGVYAYRIPALRTFSTTPPTPLENAEKLEQLRALETGMRILCVPVEQAWPGIDTPDDLAAVERRFHADEDKDAEG